MTDEAAYRAAAGRVARLARALSQLADLPTPERFADLVATAVPDEDVAFVASDWATASVTMELADFGRPRDLDPDDFDDDDAFDAARDRPFHEADAVVAIVAGALGLEPAGPFAVDVHADHGSRVLLRTGHWVVSVAAVQPDPEFPITVEAAVTYGADLPGRLARLVGDPPGGGTVDWEKVSARMLVDLPADYRWLMEHYGPGTFDGYLTLIPPDELPTPEPWADALPVATTTDEAVVSYDLDPRWHSDHWGIQIDSPRSRPWSVSTSLLYFLVITLSGAYPVPGFRDGFPSGAPRFVPAAKA
ncbi:hypothetical protein KZZ52_22845 [Dactylosporangium sp. AC04546]|uniref:hypothetical protein n=1 Tax=Dactylosporangium sp. AC04546 TaxID=2862460 RepID=UPI001EDF91F7|nr:hypothetical protein [Dactylosporangium sp. AC04546]WVK88117.1 hypothetical protein KZZ52_22845 [Dactylosporangium sp. AC04546]